MENNTQMMAQTMDTTVQTPDVSNIGVSISVPQTATDVVPLNVQQALSAYTEAERQEVMALADSIDVRKLENVMNYASVPLKRTFDQCGSFLKDERGSHADQEVISRVIELSKKASNSYDDFNLVLQEPGLFQKLLLKLTSGSKGNSRTEKLQKSAVTSYKLLVELKTSCDSWIDMLKKAMGDITNSAMSDIETISLLEKYIIAGEIAEERIVNEMKAIEDKHQQTGIAQYAHDYQELKEGHDIFVIKMNNLKKSRIMYYLSVGQLSLIKRSNIDVQIAINTQVSNSLALVGQQLRNAILNAQTKEVLEGQNAVVRLNDELIKDVSLSVGMTAEQAEKAMYASFYNTEAAKTAVTTVISSCENIKKVATEMLPKMKADVTELNGLIEQLEPVVGASIESLNNEQPSKTPTGGNASLQF